MVNKFSSFIVLLLTVFLFQSFRQNQKSSFENKFNGEKYKKEWKQVFKYEKEALPRSAVQVIDSIYKLAKSEGNQEQILKSIIYRTKFLGQIQEQDFPEIISSLEFETHKLDFPANQILQSWLASYYWAYYQQNEYNISKEIFSPEVYPANIESWGSVHFIKKVNHLIAASLQNAGQLNDIPASSFSEIIYQDKNNPVGKESLFDLLSERSIRFYTQNLSSSPSLDYDAQLLANPKLFLPAQEFAKHQFLPADSNSFNHKIIDLYQLALKVKKEANDPVSTLETDLKRIEFVFDHAIVDGQDSIYSAYLGRLFAQQNSAPMRAMVRYRQADFNVQMASNYRIGIESTYRYKSFATQAMKLYEQIIDSAPGSFEAKQAAFQIDKLTIKDLGIECEHELLPSQPFIGNLTFKNLESLEVRMMKIDTSGFPELILGRNREGLLRKLLSHSEEVYRNTISLQKKNDYNLHRTQIILPGQQTGAFLLIIQEPGMDQVSRGIKAWDMISFSNLALVERNDQINGQKEFIVVDRKKGEPIGGAEMKIFRHQFDRNGRNPHLAFVESIKSNHDGLITIRIPSNSWSGLIFNLSKGNEYLIRNNFFYVPAKEVSQEAIESTFYLDRKVFRPGQIIHFKGLVHRGNNEQNRAVAGQKSAIRLLDPQYREVSRLTLTTNEFGSISGSFVLPLSALTGKYTLQNEWGRIQFNVEEYKIPKIEIEFLPVLTEYALEDSVWISAKIKSLNGTALPATGVNYKVIRQGTMLYSYFRPYLNADRIIASGKVTSDTNGIIRICFKAKAPLNSIDDADPSVNFRIELDAHSAGGELSSNSKMIHLTNHRIQIKENLPPDGSLIDATELYSVHPENAFGEKTPGDLHLRIYQINPPKKHFETKVRQAADIELYSDSVWNTTFPEMARNGELNYENFERVKILDERSLEAGESVSFSNIPSGLWFVAEFTCIDAQGGKVQLMRYFRIRPNKIQQLIPAQPFALEIPEKEIKPGMKVPFYAGTSLNKKVHVFFEVSHEGKVLKSGWANARKGYSELFFELGGKMQGQIQIQAFTMIDGYFIKDQKQIFIPFNDKILDIKLESRRNKLTPGSHENWTLSISPKDGRLKNVELLCGMYDAALDQFEPNNWEDPFIISSRTTNIFMSETAFPQSFRYLYPGKNNSGSIPVRQASDLLWFAPGTYGNYLEGIAVSASVKSFRPRLNALRFSRENIQDDEVDHKMPITRQEEFSPTPKPAKIRKDFSESAFFYPHVEVNNDGKAQIEFTLPESITRWKFQALAHTTDLARGIFTTEFVAEKPLLAEINPPRFVYSGDSIDLPVLLSNLSDSVLYVNYNILVGDAENDESIAGSAQVQIKLKPGERSVFIKSLKIPQNLRFLKIQIKATTENFTDGEERLIPVFPSRRLFTESVALTLSDSGTKKFHFKRLEEILLNQNRQLKKLQVDVCSNPLWYAIKALPYLDNSDDKNPVSVFNRLYINSIAFYLIDIHPEILAILKQWQLDPDGKHFESQLMKNQELKKFLLQATPWFKEAESENEQMEALLNLFDRNHIEQGIRESITLLAQLQNPDGSWSWFRGMPPNRFITQQVLTGLGRLGKTGVLNLQTPELSQAIYRGLAYIDKANYKDYIRWINPLNKNPEQLSFITIDYLYLRSFFPQFSLKADQQLALDYFTDKSASTWPDQDLSEKAKIALCFIRNKNGSLAEKIIRSIKEFAIETEELGTYWKQDRNYTGSSENLQVQMIELFSEWNKDPSLLNSISIWLLNQKRTKAWKSNSITADAIYGLLKCSPQQIRQPLAVNTTVGDKIIHPNSDERVEMEAGSYFYSKTWEQNQIDKDMAQMQFTKKDSSLSWVSCHIQYSADLDQLDEYHRDLSIERKLYKKVIKNGEESWEPVQNNRIQKGDLLLIRMNFSCTRDLEFVHVNDTRPACFEPMEQLSYYKYQNGLWFYQNPRDATMNYFIEYLPEGKFVLEYMVRAVYSGSFKLGPAEIQCYYAPEYNAHSEGKKVQINP